MRQLAFLLLILACSKLYATAGNVTATPATIVEFSAETYRVSERGPKATVTVNRTGGSLGEVTVAFSTVSNGASAERDFVSTNGVLRWASGESASKVIEIEIIRDDFEEEPQDFLVSLSDPQGAVVGTRGMARVIIEDPSVRFEELYTSAYGAPARLELIVSVSGLTATRVDFFEGDMQLGTSSVPRQDGNFVFVWNNVPRGAYTLRARAFGADGFGSASPSRTIVVSSPKQGTLSLVRVDQNNTTGVEDGSAERPFTTIQKGIDNALVGANVLVALGTYRESLLIDNTIIRVMGGFQGARPQDYASGQPGNFSSIYPGNKRTVVHPPGRGVGFALYNANISQIEKFEVTGAARGFFVTADAINQSFPKLINNLISGNGEPFRAHGGGGVHAEISNLELVGNEINFNQGGRGGGVSAGGNQATVSIRDNTIQGNIGYDDHGGGLYIFANGVISENRIADNETGRGVEYGGWGGGLIIFGNSSDFFPQITLSNNIVTGNLAGNGSAEFFDEGVRATLSHELIYKNRAPVDGGGAIYADGCCNTRVVMNHCTVVDNEGYRFAGNGFNADAESSAEIRNSIFWNNGPGEFATFNNSSLVIAYTLTGAAITTGDGITAGPGNIQGDPLFADPARNDYRLRSTRGRWINGTLTKPGSWIQDLVNSPAIDTADPAADFSRETLPNGGRADLGYAGNYAETGLSATIVEQGVRIVVSGANRKPYKLERSNGLDSWAEITTLTSTTGQLEYVDEAPQFARFYRLRQ